MTAYSVLSLQCGTYISGQYGGIGCKRGSLINRREQCGFFVFDKCFALMRDMCFLFFPSASCGSIEVLRDRVTGLNISHPTIGDFTSSVRSGVVAAFLSARGIEPLEAMLTNPCLMRLTRRLLKRKEREKEEKLVRPFAGNRLRITDDYVICNPHSQISSLRHPKISTFFARLVLWD